MSLKCPHHWTEELLEQYYKQAENPFAAKRYQALLLCVRAYQRQEVAEIVGVSSRSLQHWINQAIREGLDSLGIKKHAGGNPGKLSFDQQATVDRWVEEEATITLQRLQHRLLDCFNLSLSLPQLSALLKKLGYRRVVSRKRHYQADPTRQEAYKKKLPTGLLTLREVPTTSYLVMKHGLA
ncbi:winged helix-turn-helix domain-containing protein [bacterium]|nr:winged helix-turn-helix domain-containing protein [bacterium]